MCKIEGQFVAKCSYQSDNINWKLRCLFYLFILFLILFFHGFPHHRNPVRGAGRSIFLFSFIHPSSRREGWTPPKKRDCYTHLHDRRVNRGNEICGVATSVYKTTAVGMSTKHRALIWPRVYAGTYEG